MAEELERYAYLIMVTSATNHNKYYELYTLPGETIFHVKYGRVELTEQHCTYPISQWEKKYNEKIKKGYVDQTSLHAQPQATVGFAAISNAAINDIVTKLQSYANGVVSSTYSVKVENITQAQLDTAQGILDELAGYVGRAESSCDAINNSLLQLYMTIPRHMRNTKDHLLCADTAPADPLEVDKRFAQLLGNEQDKLDALHGQVATAGVEQENTKATQNILEAMGLTFAEVTFDETTLIKSMLGPNACQFRRAFRVTNTKVQERYAAWLDKHPVPKTALFWHGSRNENWWNILQTSLVLRPTGVVISGKMFGHGLYLADKAQKSIGYTSLRGSYWARGGAATAFLAIFEAHIGRQLHIKRHEPWCGSLTWEKLRERGDYDSLYAEGGIDLRNNEFIVYKEEQLTPKYLVEIGV